MFISTLRIYYEGGVNPNTLAIFTSLKYLLYSFRIDFGTHHDRLYLWDNERIQ